MSSDKKIEVELVNGSKIVGVGRKRYLGGPFLMFSDPTHDMLGGFELRSPDYKRGVTDAIDALLDYQHEVTLRRETHGISESEELTAKHYLNLAVDYLRKELITKAKDKHDDNNA